MSQPRIVWEKNGSVLWCGDCREVLPTLERVDHVITDPPYSKDLYLRYRTNGGALYVPSAKAHRTDQAILLANMRIGAIDEILEEVALEFTRVANRWVLAFHDMEIGHLWRAAFGPAYIRTGIWVKPNGMPQVSGDRPGQGYEPCTIAHRKGRKRWNGGGLPAVWTHNAENSQSSDRALLAHPCPKPLSLMLELVSLFTDEGETVLDPFAGSGTTGAAALRLGRRFIGCELDPDFAAIAAERLEAESKGLSLRDARAGQLSLLATP
jgi:DNA modification methylase